jgi:hypothetical protein
LSARRERERDTHTHSAETIDYLEETDRERLASAGEVGKHKHLQSIHSKLLLLLVQICKDEEEAA